MAALSNDIYRDKKFNGYKIGVVAGPGTYYHGAFLTYGANGLVKPAGAATEPIAGIYDGREKTIAAGETEVFNIFRESIVLVEVPNAFAVQAKAGKNLQLVNDNDVADHSGANQVFGKVLHVDADTNILTVRMSN